MAAVPLHPSEHGKTRCRRISSSKRHHRSVHEWPQIVEYQRLAIVVRWVNWGCNKLFAGSLEPEHAKLSIQPIGPRHIILEKQ